MKGLPQGRLVQMEEAARAICFLASAESGLMSGACVDSINRSRGALRAFRRRSRSGDQTASAYLRTLFLGKDVGSQAMTNTEYTLIFGLGPKNDGMPNTWIWRSRWRRLRTRR